MANYYVSSVKYNAQTQWTAATPVTVGTIIRRTGTTTPRVFRCETAGTTGGAEPTWATTMGSTTNDNGVVWRNISADGTYGWDSSLPSLTTMTSQTNAGTDDVMLVDSNHDEVNSALSVGGGTAISIDATGAVPPVQADYKRGAKCRVTTASGSITIPAGRYIGLDFVIDTGASAGTLNVQGNNIGCVLQDCFIDIKSTNSGAGVTITSTLAGWVEWTMGTKIKFGGHASQTITPGSCKFDWNTSDASDTVSSYGVMPTSLLDMSTYNGTQLRFRGLDLSGFTGTRLINSTGTRDILFENCKIADSVGLTNGNTGDYGIDGGSPRFVDCFRTSTPTKQGMFGYELAYSRSMTSTCVLADTPDTGLGKQADCLRFNKQANQFMPLRGLILKKWNASVSALTATVRGVYFGPVLPGKRNLMLDLSYPGDANNSLTKGIYNIASPLDTSGSVTDTSDWTVAAAARANNTSYVQGDFIKVASNPGKIFIKENTGSHSSAASEPGGMATATAGDTVADGGVTWRCGIGFKVQAAFTPARAGTVRGQVKLQPIASNFYTIVLNNKLEIA